jgi:glycine cleavage system H protein
MSQVQADLFYTTDDEWVRVEGDEAVIGVTDYAQDSLSDIVFLELPSAGEQIEQGETIGVVESVKAAADLFAPLSGEVVASNEELLDTPETVNEDPYGAAWLVRIKMSDTSQLDGLMDADQYSAYLETRD